jgi:hypothetical protein
MKSIEFLATYLKSITTLNCDEIIIQAKEMYKKEIIAKYDQGSIETYNHLIKKINPSRFKDDKVQSGGSSDGYM